jgi:hypothetical protein
MTSIFKGTQKPDFGQYFITNGSTDPKVAINSVVTVTDTKVTFITKYKNEQYQKKEFTDELTIKEGIYDSKQTDMGSYSVSIAIDTIRKKVYVMYFISNTLTDAQISWGKGDIPPNFDLSYKTIDGVIYPVDDLNEKATEPKPTTTPKVTPTTTTTTTPKVTPKVTPKNISTTTKPTTPKKSFLDEYLIYIVLVVLFLLAVGTGVFVFIRNRNRMISKNKLIV